MSVKLDLDTVLAMIMSEIGCYCGRANDPEVIRERLKRELRREAK